MERIPLANSSYDDSSVLTHDTPPAFTQTAVENAQPVVPLGRARLWGRLRQDWDAFISGEHQRRFLAAVVAFGLVGGVIGGLAAAHNVDSQPTDQVAVTSESEAASPSTAAEEMTPVEDVQSPTTVTATTPSKTRRVSSLSRSYTRSAPGVRKAYRFAVIYGDSNFASGRKRGRKHDDD